MIYSVMLPFWYADFSTTITGSPSSSEPLAPSCAGATIHDHQSGTVLTHTAFAWSFPIRHRHDHQSESGKVLTHTAFAWSLRETGADAKNDNNE